jgi:hypothetical protein
MTAGWRVKVDKFTTTAYNIQQQWPLAGVSWHFQLLGTVNHPGNNSEHEENFEIDYNFLNFRSSTRYALTIGLDLDLDLSCTSLCHAGIVTLSADRG